MDVKGKILVVDDEEIVGNSCRRILTQDGHEVTYHISAIEAFKVLEREIFDLILLDIKMKEMSGVDFLKKLRKTSKDLPVIIITGHATEENFYATSQLGVFDYVRKPFSPHELVEVIKKCLKSNRGSLFQTSSDRGMVSATPQEEFHFLEESWFQVVNAANGNEEVRVGAIVPRIEKENVISFKMPTVGSQVYRGLPLAFIKGKKEDQVIHSPVSGKIVEVNKKINKDSLHLLWEDPCGEGELVRIKADNLESDLKEAKIRKVVLAISDKQRLNEKRQQLTKLGLKVFVLKDINILTNSISLMSFENSVVFIDTLSYGAEGATAIKRLNEEFPNIKVIVLADADSSCEEKYRSQKIFYYAVKPFADKEILDILFNAFVSKKGKIESYANINKDSKITPQWINKLAITTNQKKKITLLVNGSVLLHQGGLGQKLMEKFLEGQYLVETSRGAEEINYKSAEGRTKISREEANCDQLLILQLEDRKQIAGTLEVEEGKKILHVAQDTTGEKTTLLTIQENNLSSNPLDFDERILEGLAQKIFSEMVASDQKRKATVNATVASDKCSCTCSCEDQEMSDLTETEKVNRLFKKLDEFLVEYKEKPGGLIPALQVAQGLFGYLPKHVVKHVASTFKKSYSEVAGVVSFYSFFTTVPKGKYIVRVCLGTACYVRGGKQLVDELQKQLKVEVGQTTEDKVFSLDVARCFGACGLAPVITVNDVVHQRVKTSQIAAILKEYREKEEHVNEVARENAREVAREEVRGE
ncbi:MAG: NAD(P)H-dependent oxidoreductase subunit E [Oligoflexia bacterium]|nr:NAD(P)H-dependent oxidoreductase subunit E [Oligoflexia bacterium]